MGLGAILTVLDDDDVVETMTMVMTIITKMMVDGR
jgi:hypothetical protein